jgi:hypothetical protein
MTTNPATMPVNPATMPVNPGTLSHNEMFIKAEPGTTPPGTESCRNNTSNNNTSQHLAPPHKLELEWNRRSELELEWNRRSELDLYIKEEMCDWDDLPTCKENLEYTLGFEGCLHEALPELLPLQP